MYKVSVIVPNYNHAQFLPQRLESIFRQTYQDFEVILLDDCSTDNSIEILKQYANHPKVTQFIINSKNTGNPFKQWKKGIELAKGEFIWITESDDIAHPDLLEIALKKMQMDNNLSVVCVGSQFIDSQGNFIVDQSVYKTTIYRDGIIEIKTGLAYLCTIQNASAVVFKKPEKVPDLIGSFKYCGDWYFWTHILLKGNFLFIPTKLNQFRRHTNNVSFSAESKGLWFKEGFIIIKGLIKNDKINFSKTEKKQLIEYWQSKFILFKSAYNFTFKEIVKYTIDFLKLDFTVGLRTIKYILANWKYNKLKQLNLMK